MATLTAPGAFRAGPVTARTRRASRIAVVCAIGCGAGLAAGLAGFNLAQPHALFGVTEYDDGVYFSAALHLVAGALPYRDFVFVQPPGIAVLLAPFAVLAHGIGARDALAAARVLTAAVAAVNAALCGALVRHRGALAALVAAGVLGMFPDAIYATHTVLLEPYLVLFCLIALNLAFRHGHLATRGRLLGAGACLGVAASIKLWALLVAVVLIAAMLDRPRDAARCAVGIGAAAIVVCGPFFVLAPSAFVNEIVRAQLLRTARAEIPVASRLFDLAGLDGLHVTTTPPNGGTAGLTVLVVIAALVALGVVLPGLVRRRGRLGAVCAVSALGAGITVFVPSEFWVHYIYFPAALIACSLGLAAGEAAALARAIGTRAIGTRAIGTRAIGTRAIGVRGARRAARFAAAGAVLCGAALVVWAGVVGVSSERAFIAQSLPRGNPGPAIAAHIPKGACAISDAEIDLVVADRVAIGHGCPDIVDATGVWLANDPRDPIGSPVVSRRLERTWARWFARADYVVLTNAHAFRIPWTPALHRYLDTHFRLIAANRSLVFERRPHPVAPAGAELRRASAG